MWPKVHTLLSDICCLQKVHWPVCCYWGRPVSVLTRKGRDRKVDCDKSRVRFVRTVVNKTIACCKRQWFRSRMFRCGRRAGSAAPSPSASTASSSQAATYRPSFFAQPLLAPTMETVAYDSSDKLQKPRVSRHGKRMHLRYAPPSLRFVATNNKSV